MYRNILVPVDLDQPASWSKVILTATALAKCFEATMTICSVVSNSKVIMKGEWLPIGVEQLLFDARARLEGLIVEFDHGLDCDVEVAAGTISGGILEIAERIGADLIVLVSHLPAMRDHILAANAIRVARHARCSVLIARHRNA